MEKTLTEHTATGALDGIRVIDATQMLAGPICTMRLGDLGADVLKVEAPRGGEIGRRRSLAGQTRVGEALNFIGLNRNKRSVAIDLKQPAGREALYALVKQADVFVQNYRVGVASRLGVGYEELRALNPRLIHCSISGYGERGPYAFRPGQDLIVQGYSGSMWSVGADGDPPVAGGLFAVDTMTGYQAAVAIMGALFARMRTGRGQKIEVNMLHTVMDAQAQELSVHLNTGLEPQRTLSGSTHGWMGQPYGVMRTLDGYMTLAAPRLDSLAEALGDDAICAALPGLNPEAEAHELHVRIQSILLGRSTNDWIEVFDQHGLWAGPVYTYAELVADRHVVESGMIMSIDHPTLGSVRMVSPPISLSDTPASVRFPPPRLGEHTREVLEGIGYGPDEIQGLIESGAIGLLEGRDD